MTAVAGERHCCEHAVAQPVAATCWDELTSSATVAITSAHRTATEQAGCAIRNVRSSLAQTSCHPKLGTPAGGILRPSPTATPRHHAQRRATERPEPPGAAHRRPPRLPQQYETTPIAADEHGEDGEDATLPEASMVASCLP
jgi:hypothetical protein